MFWKLLYIIRLLFRAAGFFLFFILVFGGVRGDVFVGREFVKDNLVFFSVMAGICVIGMRGDGSVSILSRIGSALLIIFLGFEGYSWFVWLMQYGFAIVFAFIGIIGFFSALPEARAFSSQVEFPFSLILMILQFCSPVFMICFSAALLFNQSALLIISGIAAALSIIATFFNIFAVFKADPDDLE